MAYAFSDEVKIIEFGLPWRSLTTSTVGYPRNSWAFCFFFRLIITMSPSAAIWLQFSAESFKLSVTVS